MEARRRVHTSVITPDQLEIVTDWLQLRSWSSTTDSFLHFLGGVSRGIKDQSAVKLLIKLDIII